MNPTSRTSLSKPASSKLAGASGSRSKAVNASRPTDTTSFLIQDLAARVSAWYTTKRTIARMSKDLDTGKTELKTAVHAHGVPDEKGSLFLELATPIEVEGKKIAALKNQKSTSNGYNAEYAEKTLKAKGLWEECIEMRPVVKTDAIYALFYEKKITKAQLDKMFPQTESFSFILIGEDGKPIS